MDKYLIIEPGHFIKKEKERDVSLFTIFINKKRKSCLYVTYWPQI